MTAYYVNARITPLTGKPRIGWKQFHIAELVELTRHGVVDPTMITPLFSPYASVLPGPASQMHLSNFFTDD
jgi:hypothetical protein